MGDLARFNERVPRRESGTEPESPDVVTVGDDRSGKSQKQKLRSAWISFASRILAQLIGAAATIGLGVVVMQQYSQPGTSSTTTAPASASVPAAVAPGSDPVLAVLPIANFTGDASRDAFAAALTDAVIATLSDLPGTRVISRTSSMRYKDSTKTVPEIARELGVTHVVESSIAGEGDRLRVTVQLIDARTDHHLFARSIDVAGRDPLGLQAEIANAIAHSIKGRVAP